MRRDWTFRRERFWGEYLCRRRKEISRGHGLVRGHGIAGGVGSGDKDENREDGLVMCGG